MIYNTEDSFGTIAKIFHWVMSIAIISMLIIGFVMIGMEDSDLKWEIYGHHKAIGFFILITAALRFSWRMINIVPQLLKDVPRWNKLAAELNIKFLYVLMFLMPITGLVMSLYGGYDVRVYNLLTLPAIMKQPEVSAIAWYGHYIFAVSLALLVIMHIIGAFYHQLIRKDNILTKML